MKILVITGDKKFKPGASRFDLQRSVVDELACVYWGRGSLWPKIPQGSFDVVTAQDPFLRGVVGWVIARRKGAKLNVQVHADLDAQPFWKHVLANIMIRHADSVRVVSQKIKEQIKRMGTRGKIFVLPVFVDVERFKAIEHHTHPRFQKTVLWLGRFEKEKDPLYALVVLERVRKAGIDVGLIMLGTGSLEQALRASARNLPVEFSGWQDSASYFAEADVVLSTSPAESFGASIVEALAARVPVVALDVGIAKEAGAIVVPRDQLAEAVIDVLRTGKQGELTLRMLSAEEWAAQWRDSL
jgi:glycosyltransferase involved in cell wall biosynthesis